jgi:DNA polymerase III delta subunit
MLYLIYGSDQRAAIAKAHNLVESLRTKRPDAAFVKVEAEDWNVSIVEEHLGGQGLFSNKYIIFLDRVTENVEAKEKILDFIPSMQESTNIFIVLEGKLNAELKRAFTKSAEKVVECEEKASAEAKSFGKGGFNIFALGDALVSRDRFKAWVLYRQAIENGLEGEAIIGMLFWKMKSLKQYQRLLDLITLYHDGHRGKVDIEMGIERLIINCGNLA